MMRSEFIHHKHTPCEGVGNAIDRLQELATFNLAASKLHTTTKLMPSSSSDDSLTET